MSLLDNLMFVISNRVLGLDVRIKGVDVELVDGGVSHKELVGTLLPKFVVDVDSVVFTREFLSVLSQVVRLAQGVATGPLEHTARLLVDNLGLMMESDSFGGVRILVENSRHLSHQSVTFKVVTLKNPIAAVLAFVGVLHEGICAAGALLETIVSETAITLANGNASDLLAKTMAVAVLEAAKLYAK